MNRLLSIVLGLSVACGLKSPAATLNVNNLSSVTGGGPGSSLLLLDEAGAPIISGFVALYSFAGPGSGLVSILQPLAGATQLDLVTLSLTNSPGPGAFAGLFTTPNDGSLNGRNLFLVVGAGGSSVSSARSLSIIDTGLAFSVADSPGPPQVLNYLLTAQSTVLLGSRVGQATADWSFANQPQFSSVGVMTVVPEPSPLILLALAAVPVMRRKRAVARPC